MPLTDIMSQRIQRLVPHEGLVVNVDTWSAAHGYHTLQQQLHFMSMHSPGIVTGLEVVAWDPPNNSVVINPGIAVDSDGHMIVVADPQRFQLQTEERGTLYLILQYREVPTAGGQAPDPASPRFVLDAYRLEERRDLPDSPYLELGRVLVTGDQSPITDPRDPDNPGPNEIDLRARETCGLRPSATVRIGVVPLEMDRQGRIVNSDGVQNLVHAINNTTPYKGVYAGSVNLSQEITGCELIVLAGHQEFALADQWALVLRNFIDRGGLIMGEGSRNAITAANEYPPFRNSFLQMAERLNRELVTVERDHPIFKSHHVFAQAPEGVDGQALLVAADGLVYTDNDYGALWNGGKRDRPASREQIRAATEFGINIAAFASKRMAGRAARLTLR